MSRWSAAGLVFWFALAWGGSPGAVAAAQAAAAPPETPSVLGYAMDGLWLGVLVGSSGGYVRARRDGFEQDDWRPVVLGAGIGALTGVALGLTAGFVDLAAERPGRGYIALRDTLYGSGLGALLGTITGALVMVRSDDPEHIGFGAAIGCLSGAGVGLVIGLIEGPRVVRRAEKQGALLRAGPLLSLVRDASGALLPTPSLGGRF